MAAPLKTDDFKELLERLKTFISSDSYKNHNESILTTEKLKTMLQDVASSLRLEANRHLFKKDDVECIISILLSHLTALKTPVLSAGQFSDLDISCECLRLLRNSCAGSRDNQLLINKSSSQFVQALPELFTGCLKYSEQSESQNQLESNQLFQTLLRCAMQFVGNCVVGCSENVELFWNSLFSLFSQLLSCDDPTLRSYTCMVIYNCLTNDHLDQLLDNDHGWSIVGHILVNLSAGDCEWRLYIIQKILTVPESLKRLWSSMDSIKKALLLDVIFLSLETVAKDTSQDAVALDTTNILLISELFSSAVETLLNPSKHSLDVPPRLLCQMLDCLRTSSSVVSLLSHLQGHPDLVLSSIMLLRAVHSPQSQSKDNRFEESLRKTKSVYRLKKDIVQLLGNLVFKHTTNQDLLRESNGISLIMDQTKIDEANPFIAQWALFAVRNLCENNPRNQQVIADMKLQGLADDVNFLQDHGIKAEIINGQILIQPNDN